MTSTRKSHALGDMRNAALALENAVRQLAGAVAWLSRPEDEKLRRHLLALSARLEAERLALQERWSAECEREGVKA